MPNYLIAPSGRRAQRSLVLIPFLALLVAGCHRDSVKVYRIARDQDQPSQPSSPALPTDSPNPSLPPGHPDISGSSAASVPAMPRSGLPQLTWQTPNGWTEVPPGEMRVGSFKVQGPDGKQADVSIIPLPGMAGSDDANVNRWRSQVGLAAASPDELNKSAQAVDLGGQSAQLYDLAGQDSGSGNAERIIAVIQHRDDVSWFFKMTGDAGLVEQQKPAFIAFLKSVQFSAAPAQAALPPGHPGIGDMGAGTTPAVGATSSAGKPNWQVPAGWQETPAGQFLVGKFVVTGGGGATADVNISSSAGTGGGLVANINRWRGQLGLAQWSDAEVNQSVTAIDIAGGKASLVDLSGTDVRTGRPTRLIGIVVPQADQTWFYKLMGDSTVVESQKIAFLQFVQGVKY